MRFGHSFRLVLTVLLLVAVVQAGPIGITRYSGPDFPYSAGFFALSHSVAEPRPIRAATFVDTEGTRAANYYAGSEPEDATGWSSAACIASAVDPAVFYVHSLNGDNGIDVVRRVGSHNQVLRTIPFRRPFGNTFLYFAGVKRNRSGADVVYFRASSLGLAAILDRDGDGLADTVLDRNNDSYDDHAVFGDYALHAVSGDGTGYGFEFVNVAFPSIDRVYAYTVRDTDGDLVPDTPDWPGDPRGRVEITGVDGFPLGDGMVDDGTGRLVLGYGKYSATLEVDGDGFPAPDSFRPSIVVHEDGGIPFVTRLDLGGRPTILSDGATFGFFIYLNDSTSLDASGIYVLDDSDYSGSTDISLSSPGELREAVSRLRFEPNEQIVRPSSHELAELQISDSGSTNIRFADFGIWPDGRAFSFRQAGVERTSVNVSLNGLLSFVGPVAASPSLATLDATPGLVAPAWSDQWDTSKVRVFAGCAPVQRRFADGSGSAALSFVVEWRGLISPNGKRTNLRCLLLEDGSFRVDYGAMEIGDMPIVVGYSTDGAGAIVEDDLSDNSWGGSPAGTLDESALGEEFGAATSFDLAHKWIRFAGYGESRGPRPELIGVALKKGNRIQMKASGSNIQPGATLVVGGMETFSLAKSAAGSKWVVTKKARSTPGATSVAEIWSDGAPHSIVIVNPDGGRSVSLELR